MSITGNIDKGSKSLYGGVSKVYLFPYTKYSRSQIVLDGQFLASFPSTTVFDWYSVASNYTETTSINSSNVEWGQSLTIEIPKTDASSEVYKLLKQDYRAIIIDRIGNIRILGLYNGLEAQVSNTTAQDYSGQNGYKITLTGKEDNQAYYLTDLEDTGFTIYDNNNYVFQDGCNYVFEDGTNFIFN
tara:strand:+ start:401 stop:958 length:558 start_codon:yes stop_codon:yes gene_type:complete